jgi:hypothetical protein
MGRIMIGDNTHHADSVFLARHFEFVRVVAAPAMILLALRGNFSGG